MKELKIFLKVISIIKEKEVFFLNKKYKKLKLL